MMANITTLLASEKTLRLRDGRTLGYAEFGTEGGAVLFYFHGHPGSRLEAGFLADAARNSGVRLIGIDRPGFGLSSYKPRRRVLDWPDDVVELADSLGIDRFAVVGFSGGGPYALACAYKIANRLTACGVVSGVGHTSRFVSFLAIWLPWLVLPITKRFFSSEEQARNTLARFAGRWEEADKKAFAHPNVPEIMAASLAESMRQGTRGAASDGTLIGGRDWGFALEDISFREVHLWHGERDTHIPVAQIRDVTTRLAQCTTNYYANEGHISTIVNHQEEIVSTLLQ